MKKQTAVIPFMLLALAYGTAESVYSYELTPSIAASSSSGVSSAVVDAATVQSIEAQIQKLIDMIRKLQADLAAMQATITRNPDGTINVVTEPAKADPADTERAKDGDVAEPGLKTKTLESSPTEASSTTQQTDEDKAETEQRRND